MFININFTEGMYYIVVNAAVTSGSKGRIPL